MSVLKLTLPNPAPASPAEAQLKVANALLLEALTILERQYRRVIDRDVVDQSDRMPNDQLIWKMRVEKHLEGAKWTP